MGVIVGYTLYIQPPCHFITAYPSKKYKICFLERNPYARRYFPNPERFCPTKQPFCPTKRANPSIFGFSVSNSSFGPASPTPQSVSYPSGILLPFPRFCPSSLLRPLPLQQFLNLSQNAVPSPRIHGFLVSFLSIGGAFISILGHFQ